SGPGAGTWQPPVGNGPRHDAVPASIRPIGRWSYALVPLPVARRGGGPAMQPEDHDLVDECERQAQHEPDRRDLKSPGIAARAVGGEGECGAAGGPEHDGEERGRRGAEYAEQEGAGAEEGEQEPVAPQPRTPAHDSR